MGHICPFASHRVYVETLYNRQRKATIFIMGMVLLWEAEGNGDRSRMAWGEAEFYGPFRLQLGWPERESLVLRHSWQNILTSHGQTSCHMALLLSIRWAWCGHGADGVSAAPQFRRKAKGTEPHGGQLWDMELKGKSEGENGFSPCQGQPVFWPTSFFLPFFPFPGDICLTLYT